MALLKVKVVPVSSRGKIDDWLGDSLKIRVTARAEKGKANDAVIALLAKTLQVSRRDISILAGSSSPRKVIKIKRLTESVIRPRLAGQAD